MQSYLQAIVLACIDGRWEGGDRAGRSLEKGGEAAHRAVNVII